MADGEAGAAGGADNGAASDTGAALSVSGDGAGAAGAAAAANGAAAAAGGGQSDTTAAVATTWREFVGKQYPGLEGDEAEFAARIQGPQDAIKVAFDLRNSNAKLLNTMVRVPGKDAKPEDVQKFHKAIGVPEKPEDYKFEIGREATDGDKAIQGQIAQVFHKHGVPAEAATAVSKAVQELAQAQIEEQNRVAVQSRTDAEAKLKQELGADFDKNLNMAKRAVEVFGGDELKAFFDSTIVNGQKLGDHPALVKAWGKIGLRMGEGEFIGSVGAGERGSLQNELAQIMADNPPGSEKYKSPTVQKRIAEINSALYGNKPAVGAGGRTY